MSIRIGPARIVSEITGPIKVMRDDKQIIRRG